MPKTTVKDKITKKFTQYLSDLDLSRKSLKNYKSDVSHFAAWLIFKTRSWGVYAEEFTEALPFINKNTSNEYLNYLIQNDIPESTINRRLSTLRHLGNFLLISQILDFDFMDGISNVSLNEAEDKSEDHPLVIEFEKHLESDDISKNTVKNYKSDVRQFIEWLEKRKVQPQVN